MSTIDYLRKKLKEINQEHLLKFWNELTTEQQEIYLNQLKSIEFDKITQLFKDATESLDEAPNLLDQRMQPIPSSKFESEENLNNETLTKYRQLGYEKISNGNVCVLLLAGGQGTRLGVNYPKGMYSVDLPSGKTLFQLQAERIRKIEQLAEQYTGKYGQVLWYIMTSGPTDKATEKFLHANNYFGLSKDNVILFKQGLLPCFDFDGKIILDNKYSVALAPDGNGGIYSALDRNGILNDMEKRGIKYIHVHSVDNILVKVADPVFIGYCVNRNADCGTKVVKKAGPSEAVGVVCRVDNKFQVVEYSEITEKTANLKDELGNLLFNAGNICNHLFTLDFLKDIAKKYETKLKLHVARKKIPYITNDGCIIKPTTPNGIKIEKFVFDVFAFSQNFVTWEVPRHTEFSALKNDNNVGKDCPNTAKVDLLALHKKYIEHAGGHVMDNCNVEISPLLSYAGENLELYVKGKNFNSTMVLTEEQPILNGY